ncbi:MAG: hypothetical protein ACPLRH_05330 [Desulfotomaculales bacterium]
MKVLLYRYKVCGQIFESEDEARSCEARDTARVYPVGMIILEEFLLKRRRF